MTRLAAAVSLSLVTLLAGLALRAINSSVDSNTHNTHLYAVAIDGSGLTSLIPDGHQAYWGPAWSPDGQQLAYTVIPPNGPGQLFLARADGTDGKQLTNDEYGGYLPTWSHDSTRIAYVGQLGTDMTTARLFVVSADGADRKRLTANDDWEYGASWAPDGTAIVFGARHDGAWGLYTQPAPGTSAAILGDAGDGNAPDWSPDGNHIAFKSGRTGHDGIYVADTDGATVRLLVGDDAHDANNPKWSPDGQRIAFSWDRDGKYDVFVVDAGGGVPVNLTHALPLSVGVPTWSADGQRIAFHAYDVGIVATWMPRLLRSLVVILHAAVLVGFLSMLDRVPRGAITGFGVVAGLAISALLDEVALGVAVVLGGVLSEFALVPIRTRWTLPVVFYGPVLIYLGITQPDDFPWPIVLVTLILACAAGLGTIRVASNMLCKRPDLGQ